MKCCILHFFSTSVLTPDYFLNSTPIQSQKFQRDLRVIFFMGLSWSHQYSRVSISAYQLLGLLRCFFSQSNSISTKMLYTSLVRSCILYASPVWRPHVIKDIRQLEQIQCWATKFILNDFQSEYKTRLSFLNLLPLMMMFELNDILFFIKNYISPQNCFQITKWSEFISTSTCSSTSHKLTFSQQNFSSHNYHSFFDKLSHLWNALPPLDLTLSVSTLSRLIRTQFNNKFLTQFNPEILLHIIMPAHVSHALLYPSAQTLQIIKLSHALLYPSAQTLRIIKI